MFDIGWTEILVIVIVTVLVVGPKELPGMLRTIGKTVGNLRRMAGDFQGQFNDALREAELDEVKNTISDIRKLDPTTAVKDAVKKQLTSVDDLTEDLSSQMASSKDDINASLNAEPDATAANTDVADLVDEEPATSNVEASAEASRPDEATPEPEETKKAD